VAPQSVPDSWVRMQAPEWLWRAASIFRDAGLQVRAHGCPPGERVIATDEQFLRRRPELVEARYLAGPGGSALGFEGLGGLSEDVVDASARKTLAEHGVRIPQGSDSLVDSITRAKLRVMVVRGHEVGGVVKGVWDDLSNSRVEGSSNPAFPNAAVVAIKRHRTLLQRVHLLPLVLRLRHDPLAQAGDLERLRMESESGGLIFNASNGLRDGVYFLEPYLSPLLGALSPAVWAFSAPRGHGQLIFSLGRQLAGLPEFPTDLLGTISVPGAQEAVDFHDFQPSAAASATNWWANRLNEMFGVLSDFSVFASRDHLHLPSQHLQALLSVEQLFRRVTSALLSDRDKNARLVLLFTALDTLEGLTGHNLQWMCELGNAESVLERARAQMPTAAQDILLPGASRGVAALRRLQDGFFLKTPDGRLDVHADGRPPMSLAQGAAEYLKMMRNATHGHGPTRARQRDLAEQLLARHDGELHPDLGLLAYLYLLDLLVEPARLRRILSSDASRSAQAA